MLTAGAESSKELSSAMHKTIKKVTEDIEAMKFNTAIAAVMTLLNQIYDNGTINRAELKDLLLIVNPFAPHVTEEMWSTLGYGEMLAKDGVWPTFDEAKCVDDTVEIVVQINGKIRAKLDVPTEISNDDAIALAKADEKIAEELAGKSIIKEIYVKGKLVNIVAK